MARSEVRERILGHLTAPSFSDYGSARWVDGISTKSMIPLLTERLLTTGSPLAQEEVKGQLARYISGFTRSHLVAPKDYLGPDDERAPRFASQLMASWTAGNVMAEVSGLPQAVKTEHIAASMDQHHQMIKSYHPVVNGITRDDYWRGIAVLSLIEISVPLDNKKDVDAALRFIYLPGGHPDIQREITLINDRRSYDADLISALLKNSAEVASAIQNGVL